VKIKITNTLIFLILTIFYAYPQAYRKPVCSQILSQHFDSLYRVDPRLVNGNFYLDPTPPSTQGDPFYGDPSWHQGSVDLDGITFNGLQLRYDICNNEIVCYVIDLKGSALQLALARNRIDSFDLDHLKFIRYPGKETPYAGRFCRIVAEGKVTLMNFQSKHLKVLTSSTTAYSYELNSRFFLMRDSVITAYKGPNSIYRLFPDLKPELKAFVRSGKLRFGRNRFDDHQLFINHLNTLLEKEK
jgi:hypothetical protein